MLEALKADLPVGKSLRKANMVRVAGLLIKQLKKKQPIDNNLLKSLKDEQTRQFCFKPGKPKTLS